MARGAWGWFAGRDGSRGVGVRVGAFPRSVTARSIGAMGRVVVAVLLTWVVAFPAAAGLREEVAELARSSAIARAGAEVGVFVARVDPAAGTVTPLVELGADTPMIPASNMKVLTTAAALDRLGPAFVFRTALAVRRADGRVEVAAVGDGDPAFGDAEYLNRFGWTPTTVFDAWARALREEGITRIDRLSVDDSVFDRERVHPTWHPNDLPKSYAAQVGGLNLNANTLDLYLTRRGMGRPVTYRTDPPTRFAAIDSSAVGGDRDAIWLTRKAGGNDVYLGGETDARIEQGPLRITIDDPTAYAGTVLAERLAAAGIEVADGPAVTDAVRPALLDGTGGWEVLRVHETRLATVLGRTNKDSENLYAESLLKRLGHAADGGPGSWRGGAAAVGDYLSGLGLDTDGLVVNDGSGLSAGNRVTPRMLGRTLADMLIRHRATFVPSLSIAGVDGTLRSRFAAADRRDLRGRVRAKSGYIGGVSTLSGVLEDGGTWYVFSVMCNDVPPGKTGLAKTLQERVVALIDDAAD